MHALAIIDTTTGAVDVVHTCCDEATPLALLDRLTPDELIDYRTGVTDPETGTITGTHYQFVRKEQPDPHWPTLRERIWLVAKDYPVVIKAVVQRAYGGFKFIATPAPKVTCEHYPPHRH